jgi:hypothetical protein
MCSHRLRSADIPSTDGSIRIDYGYLNRSDSDVRSFHTRQITFPVLFTVYHTLEINQLDLARLVGPPAAAHVQLPNGGDAHGLTANDGKLSVPLSGATSRPTTPRRGSFVLGEDALRQKLQEESDGRHCLLSIGVRNVYGVPFEVTLTRSNDGEARIHLEVNVLTDWTDQTGRWSSADWCPLGQRNGECNGIQS